MKTIVLVILFVSTSFVTFLQAQETFENKAKAIGVAIQNITKEEKEALKNEIENVDKLIETGVITPEKAEEEKRKLAQIRANNIETRVAEQESKLQQLIKDQVDNKIKNNEEVDTIKFKKNRIVIKWEEGGYKSQKNNVFKEKRTTTQFVFALGLNNLLVDNNLSSLNDSDFRVWGSRFYEWGFTYNTRIFKNDNLLHAKYGFSVMYNNLRPTENRFFVKEGNQTSLATFANSLDESRFRNVQLVFPLHLEFDFTPKKKNEKGETYFRTHQSFRLGIGGYGGFNIKSKQILKYQDDDVNVKVKEKGDFNVSSFVYGLSAYVGYDMLSLYVKYDINPLFRNNTIDQNNISFGLRFDFN